MDEEDLDIDNILNDKRKKRKKKIDGKAKGDRTELGLCKLLTDHFGEPFSKALGSGSRGKQVNLPEYAKKSLSGDVCVPENFKWVIESKGGYEEEMDSWRIVDGKLPQLDEFIKQVSGDAKDCQRKPIICWKRNRKSWLACILLKDLGPTLKEQDFPNRIHYGDWIVIPFDKLLEITEKSFWFNEAKNG